MADKKQKDKVSSANCSQIKNNEKDVICERNINNWKFLPMPFTYIHSIWFIDWQAAIHKFDFFLNVLTILYYITYW